MARRKSTGSKFWVAEVLPIWTTQQSETINLVAASFFWGYGITDIRSYFQKLRNPVVLSVIVCALIGVSGYGLKGVILGGLLGLFAPAALLWLGVLLIGIFLHLTVFVVTWAVILWVAGWLLHS